MQHCGAGVLQNAYPGLQQRLVVGALRHIGEELVAFFADDHGGFDARERCVGECLQQGFVGHEVG